jgi:hypothetical protein
MFLAVPRASGPVFMFCALELVFMFCAPGLVFDDTEGVGYCFLVLRSLNHFDGAECVGSHFYVLRARTRFRWYRGRQIPFSCFKRSDSFSTVPRSSGPVFMFCAPRLVFDGTEGVGSRFHVLSARTRFRRYRGRQISFSCFAPELIFDDTEGVGYRL